MMRRFVERLLRFVLCAYLVASIIALLLAILRLLRSCLRDRPRRPDQPELPAETGFVPEHAIRQADPLVYSQQWLISQGLAVTWQNPDFRIEEAAVPGVAAPSWDLHPDTDYRVYVNVWNGSGSAPAVGVGVEVGYIDFGIGGVLVPVGTTAVDLPVKGAAGTPAVAAVDWHTPSTPGHYCLQARLIWPHDAEPGNNLGQHNVDVKPFNSPTARFVVPVRNTGRWPIAVRLAVDGYELPALEPCPPQDREPKDKREAARARHAPQRHELGDEWQVDLDGVDDGRIQLDPGETRQVTVALTAPDGFTGRRAINVQGWDGHRLVGGVTLIGEGAS